MRLRQIALVAHDLEPYVQDLEAVLGIHVSHRDPNVAAYGLVNVVFPVGGEFLEIVQPVKDDASAARYLKRRGGDAGYMVLFHSGNALTHRARLEAKGLRKIAEQEDENYVFTHFHPGDFDGVLTSIDSVGGITDPLEPYCDWPFAGPDWKSFSSDANVLGMPAATIQTRDPAAAAKRWADHLNSSVDESNTVSFESGKIRFVLPVDEDGTGVIGIDVAVRNPAPVLAAAKKRGLSVSDTGFSLCGITFTLV